MDAPNLGRRTFLGSSAAALATVGATRTVDAGDSDSFSYAVTRTEAEWRDMLSDVEYYVLRDGGTEAPRTSTLWNETSVGTYCCKGCDLKLYESLQKVELDKGWVFFRHSFPNTVLTDIDTAGAAMSDPFARMAAMLEVHCRRCGSHLGHIVSLADVPDRPIHCINGFALNFEASAA